MAAPFGQPFFVLITFLLEISNIIVYVKMNFQEDNKIRLLPDFIANQIAAGEVVQRPESVVKELVENSLDAGADSILLSVKNAGKSLIHVIDNGFGMTKDDLELSIKRHATSKVFKSEDLEEIKTFGFRGEALASVCSVANVEIRTKKNEDPHGWRLDSEPMRDVSVEPFNCDNGTQIFVRNLFYNVPARKKFLKSNLTEFRYISDTLIKICLANPDKRFTFYDEDSLIFDLNPESQENRIVSLLGKNLENGLIKLDYENEFIKISGFVNQPHISRQNRSGQYFFLNKRPIQSNALYHAVSSCYEELLSGNQKPVFIVNLEMDYSKVDVNVHPQKHEVKFDDEKMVYNSLKSAVMNALSSENYLSNPDMELITSASPFASVTFGDEKIFVNKMTGEIVDSKNNSFDYAAKNFDNSQNSIKPRLHSAFDDIFDRVNDNNYTIPIVSILNPQEIKYNYILNRFILIPVDDNLLIIDQSGFHQRMIYDKARKFYNENHSAYSVQQLLFPINVKYDSYSESKLNSLIHQFNNFGFNAVIDGEMISFTEIPDFIIQGREEYILNNFVRAVLSENFTDIQQEVEKIQTSLAESSSVQNGTELKEEEIRNLIASIQNYKIPVFSPKGKKSVIRVSTQEFYNKLFFSS